MLGVIIVGLGGVAILAAGDRAECGTDVGLTEPGQAGEGGSARRDGGQALLGIAVVRFRGDPRLALPAAFAWRPSGRRGLAGGPPGCGPVERPGLEGGHELALVDDSGLRAEQSEEKMSVSGGHGHSPWRASSRYTRPRHGTAAQDERRVTDILAWSYGLRIPPGPRKGNPGLLHANNGPARDRARRKAPP